MDDLDSIDSLMVSSVHGWHQGGWRKPVAAGGLGSDAPVGRIDKLGDQKWCQMLAEVFDSAPHCEDTTGLRKLPQKSQGYKNWWKYKYINIW